VSAAADLARRGWIDNGVDAMGVKIYVDPLNPMMDGVGEEDALAVQRARDEDREAAAWVQFAATFAGMLSKDGDGNVGPMYERQRAAILADTMLGEYRLRFGGVR